MTMHIASRALATLAASVSLVALSSVAALAQAKASSPAGSPYGTPLEPFLVLWLIPVFGIIAGIVARVTDQRVRGGN